ncbi:MAG: helix-hairpin-helix domain-containing protein [Actinomycetota bacterium]|nr:helix-hairpin-helix domain-containing protein [Actinomycetota bacterium]
MFGVRLFIAAAWLLLLSTCPAPSTALAQGGGPDSPGFSIAAVDQESFFSFKAEPGASVAGALRLTPDEGRRTEVVLKAVDVRTAATGGIEYGSKDPDGVGSWIHLGETRVTLAGLPVEVPFKARVPKDAQPGDHFAGIIAYDEQALDEQKDTKGQLQLQFVSRLAVATQFTVPGEKSADVQFGGASIDVTPSGALLHLNFANAGNALAEDITGNVLLSQGERPLFREQLEMTSFLPETEIAYPVTFASTPAEDTYRLTGSFRVEKGPRQEIDVLVEFGADQADEFEEETGREPIRAGGVSLVTIGLVLLGVLLLGATIVVLRRRGIRSLGGGGVDLNTAGVEELADLPGVGRRAAERILDHREEYGRFRTVEELERVEGFDSGRVQSLRSHVRV